MALGLALTSAAASSAFRSLLASNPSVSTTRFWPSTKPLRRNSSKNAIIAGVFLPTGTRNPRRYVRPGSWLRVTAGHTAVAIPRAARKSRRLICLPPKARDYPNRPISLQEVKQQIDFGEMGFEAFSSSINFGGGPKAKSRLPLRCVRRTPKADVEVAASNVG